ncbi:MAG: phasin family protein [Candidatus Riflebacteria bacterium]|nr:phasin family protein [Candidatus Riflebacteria bacterium]
MRVIKRYPNRKLYDTTARHYVTLQLIRDIIGKGEAVQVVDSRTGKDVTKAALSKIVFEKEMADGGSLPASFLTDLIQKSGRTVMGYIKKSWAAGVEVAHRAEKEINRKVSRAAKAGKVSLAEVADMHKEFLDKVKSKFSEQETYIEEQFKSAVEKAIRSAGLVTRSDLACLDEKIRTLKSRLDVIAPEPAPKRGASRPRRK